MRYRRKVLLVEDDPGTRAFLRNMLMKVDPYVAVVQAESAEMAYLILNEAKLDGVRYDLVVADVNLPGSNALLLWEIVAKRFEIPFLFISGMSPELWRQQTHDIPEQLHFLPKPIQEEALRSFWASHMAEMAP